MMLWLDQTGEVQLDLFETLNWGWLRDNRQGLSDRARLTIQNVFAGHAPASGLNRLSDRTDSQVADNFETALLGASNIEEQISSAAERRKHQVDQDLSL